MELTVWDSSLAPPDLPGRVVSWNGRANAGPALSLLEYAEENSDRLRAKYLAWVHEVGQTRVHGRRLVEHLALPHGLSYWWLTKLVEKSPHRSPVSDAVRLLALEEILERDAPRSIRLVSPDPRRAEALRGLSARLGIPFEWSRARSESTPEIGASPGGLALAAGALRALIRHLRIGAPFRRRGKPRWFAGERAVFMCGYFANVAPSEADRGRFHSRYWEGLHDLLRELGRCPNWLHHNAQPPAETALRWTASFNRSGTEEGHHQFLDRYLSFGIAWRVLRGWVGLTAVRLRLGALEEAFRGSSSKVSLWPLMRADWEDSLSGPTAIATLLALELFDAALKDLPHQPLGLYLCENNAWERALIHAWRRHGHGRLIGVVHSTVVYWNLRLFSDARDLSADDGDWALPRPHSVALNGRDAIDAFEAAGFPDREVIPCEALRYNHLLGMAGTDRGRRGGYRILVITDFMREFTDRTLRLLQDAAARLPPGYSFTVKPHPVCPVEPKDFPGLRLTVITNPLEDVLPEFDIALAGSRTSGAVDVWLAGLPVIVAIEDDQLNLSPLRGQPGVRFASSAEDLAAALAQPTADAGPSRKDFFFLDPNLPRWRRLLASFPGANG